MRIIAGDYRGRRLVAPKGLAVRPTSDRVKEAEFNILGPPVRRAGARFRVLDLFAGSGALALEALSRGADEALLVDEDGAAISAAEKNAESLAVSSKIRVVRREVGAAIPSLQGPFDWIFVDPPYEGGALNRALRLLGGTSLCASPTGVVVAEHDVRNLPEDRYGKLALADRRRWGQTAVSFYRPAAPVVAADAKAESISASTTAAMTAPSTTPDTTAHTTPTTKERG